MQANQNQSSDTLEEKKDTHKEEAASVFIKPIVKRFIDETKTVYMIMSDKGKSIAVFNSIKELDDFAKSMKLTDDTYGISKALINAYTVLHAKEEETTRDGL